MRLAGADSAAADNVQADGLGPGFASAYEPDGSLAAGLEAFADLRMYRSACLATGSGGAVRAVDERHAGQSPAAGVSLRGGACLRSAAGLQAGRNQSCVPQFDYKANVCAQGLCWHGRLPAAAEVLCLKKADADRDVAQ